MHTELALNTRETSRIAKAQETTNGKVAAHEVRQQSLEANQAVMATALAEIKSEKKENTKNRSATQSRVFWAIAGVTVSGVLSLLGRFVTYLIQTDALKNIIK